MDEIEVKSFIRSVLISADGPLTLIDFEKDYRKLTGITIEYGKFGYSSTFALLKAFSDVIHIEGFGRQAILTPVVSENTQHISHLVKKTALRNKNFKKPYQTSTDPITTPDDDDNDEWDPPPLSREDSDVEDEVKTNKSDDSDEEDLLEKLTRPSKSQIQIKKLKNVSEAPHLLCKEVLKEEKVSLSHILRNLTMKKEEEKSPTNNKKKQHENEEWNPQTQKFLPYAMFKQVQSSSASVKSCDKKSEVESVESEIEFPTNCTRDASRIRSENANEEFKKEEFIPIKIMEIYSPYRFWFILNDKDEKLQLLQTEVNEFYKQIEVNDYIFKPKNGDACAARCFGLWYRAEVVQDKKDNNEMITVYLFDFGAVMKVSLKYVRALLTRFTRMPRQALRGRVASLKPIELKWTLPAVDAFKKLVDNKILVARMETMDPKLGIYFVTLIDTNGDDDTDINEQMLELKMAEEADIRGGDSMELRYPTFKMIECGNCQPIAE